MALLKLGKGFDAVVSGVIQGITNDNVGSNTFSVEATFVSQNYAQAVTLSREIEKVTFIQDFIHDYRDKITIELRVSVANYKWLFNNRAELFCRLDFSRVHMADGTPKKGSAMFSRSYKCVLITLADPDKVVPASVNESDAPFLDRTNATYLMKLELISYEVYKARKKRLNAILRGNGETSVTIESAIYYAVAHYGFTKAVIIPPDNDTKYVNFVIPPMYGINGIMQFFQQSPGHGVYNNGLCSYIQDDVWYVYPRYEGYIKRRPVYLYRIAPGMYSGVNKYDWVQSLSSGDTATHILLMDKVEERNLAMIGYENNPNTVSMQISGMMVDACRTMTKDKEFKMNPQIRNAAFITNPVDTPDYESNINLEFEYSHNNTFDIQSRTVSLNQTRLEFKVRMAFPYMFGPGSIVKYIYEHKSGNNMVIRSMSGAAERVVTTFERDVGSRTYPLFYGDANVVISCNNALARDDGII